MIIKIRRGNTLVTETLSDDQDKQEEFSLDNLMKVKIIRQHSIEQPIETTDLPNTKSIKFKVQENISNDINRADEDKNKDFDTDSTFIPKPNNTETILKAYGLSDRDFEEPVEENLKKKDEDNHQEDELVEKYRDLYDEDEDHFEKIKKKKNLDNF